MHRIMTFALCLLLAGLFSLSAEERKSKDNAEPKKLTATYTILKGQRDGKDIPKEHFKGAVVTFTAEKIFGHDREKKEFFAATYTLDTSSKPWKIHMTSSAPKKGETADGILEADGDTVRICYALPGGKTPTTFTAGEKQHCFTLKRMAKTTR
jgi:uncharacterized protein (TIGR03067 family)